MDQLRNKTAFVLILDSILNCCAVILESKSLLVDVWRTPICEWLRKKLMKRRSSKSSPTALFPIFLEWLQLQLSLC